MNDAPHNAAVQIDATLLPIITSLGGDVTMLPPDCFGYGGTSRLVPEGEGVSGWYECTTIRPGFSLVAADMSYDQAHAVDIVGGDALKFHFKLSGRSIISGCSRSDIVVDPGFLSYLVQPDASIKNELLPAHTRERSVTMICSKTFAQMLIEPYISRLPAEFGDFIAGAPSGMALGSLPLTTEMRGVVESVLYPQQSHALHGMLTEARSLELLHLAINQLIDQRTAVETVRARDRKRVQDLCRILENDFTATLSISELSRLVAWNETQLMQCFKRVTGTTISLYRQQVCMQRALRRLHQTDDSVADIAFDAGYEHPGNFATAFRRMFGYPPRDARPRWSDLQRR